MTSDLHKRNNRRTRGGTDTNRETETAQRSGISEGPDKKGKQVELTIDGQTFAQAVIGAIHGNPEESTE